MFGIGKERVKILLQITSSVKNRIRYYIFNLLKLFIFKRKTNIRTMPDNSLYITIIPQCAERNHYSAANGELLRLRDTACFFSEWWFLCYKVINKTKFLQMILFTTSFCHFIYSFIYFHSFIFIYLFILFGGDAYITSQVLETLTRLCHNARNFFRHKLNLNDSQILLQNLMCKNQ